MIRLCGQGFLLPLKFHKDNKVMQLPFRCLYTTGGWVSHCMPCHPMAWTGKVWLSALEKSQHSFKDFWLSRLFHQHCEHYCWIIFLQSSVSPHIAIVPLVKAGIVVILERSRRGVCCNWERRVCSGGLVLHVSYDGLVIQAVVYGSFLVSINVEIL
jgi:hypothetical protein